MAQMLGARTGALAYAGSASRADTGLAVGSVPAGLRVAKLQIASGSRCETATRLPARRVAGCGGAALGCTSWPAFCLAAGAVRRWFPGTYPVPVD